MQCCKRLSLGLTFLSFSSPENAVDWYFCISICFKLRKVTFQTTYHLSKCYIFIKILFVIRENQYTLLKIRFKNCLNMLFGTPPSFYHLSDIISSGLFVELIYRSIFYDPNDTKATSWSGKVLCLNITGSIIKAVLLINPDCSSSVMEESPLLIIIIIFITLDSLLFLNLHFVKMKAGMYSR